MAIHAPVPVILAAVVAAGVSRPVLAGAVQSLWSRITARGSTARKSAYAMHAMQLNFVWILGPMTVAGIVSAFGQSIGPVVAMAISGAFTCAGAFMVAFVWRRHRVPPTRTQNDLGTGDQTAEVTSLYTRPYLGVLASVVLFEAALGSGFVTIGAFADWSGAASVTGVLVATWFTGSIVGGGWFGMRHVSRPLKHQYCLLLVALGAGYAVCGVLSTPWQLGITLFVAGTVLSPTHTVQYNLIAALSPGNARAEAFTWLSTSTGAGGALGSALTGPLMNYFGHPRAGFGLAALCALGAAGLAVVAFAGRTTAADVPVDADGTTE
jgi:hypothetical protein